MQCTECGAGIENLKGTVDIKVVASLAAQRGSIKVGGVKVTQIDVKQAWDNDSKGNEKTIKGPIFCMQCGHEMYYHKEKKPPLRSGNWEHAAAAEMAKEEE